MVEHSDVSNTRDYAWTQQYMHAMNVLKKEQMEAYSGCSLYALITKEMSNFPGKTDVKHRICVWVSSLSHGKP